MLRQTRSWPRNPQRPTPPATGATFPVSPALQGCYPAAPGRQNPGQTGPGPSWDGTLLVGDHNQLTNKPLAQKLYGCVRAQLLHASLFMTPQTVARQAPLPMRFSRQEYWSGSPCPPPGDLPNPEFELRPPTSKTDSLLLSHWGTPLRFNTQSKRCCPRTVEV